MNVILSQVLLLTLYRCGSLRNDFRLVWINDHGICQVMHNAVVVIWRAKDPNLSAKTQKNVLFKTKMLMLVPRKLTLRNILIIDSDPELEQVKLLGAIGHFKCIFKLFRTKITLCKGIVLKEIQSGR